MDKETLEALRGSIVKWEKIASGEGKDCGAVNCPLCRLFNNDDEGKGFCFGCPVMGRTGVDGCDGTPYVEFHKIAANMPDQRQFSVFSFTGGYVASTDALKTIAKQEVEFLRSLLPEVM